MAAKVKDEITKDGVNFFKEIEELKKLQVRVGYQSGETIDEETGADLAQVAAYNELGTSRIPPRPFLKRSVDENERIISAMCAAQLRGLAAGKITADEILKAIGAMQVGLVKRTIGNSKEWAEPNADSTIARKTKGKGKRKKVGDQPLVDTGQLRQSVHYVIKPKGGEE